MSLENLIGAGRIVLPQSSEQESKGVSRRDFIKRGVGWGLTATGLLVFTGCGGGTVVGPTPTNYTVTAQFRNSDGAMLGNDVSYTVQSGSPVSISVSDMHSRGLNTSVIDSKYLIMRGLPVGGFVGNFYGSTNTGGLSFVPTSNMSVVIYGLNISNGADYAGAFASCTLGQGMLARSCGVRRLLPGEKPYSDIDVMVGPDQPIIDAIGMVNDELKMSDGTKVAQMTWTPDNSGATVAAGYYSGHSEGLNNFLYPAFMANILSTYDDPGAKNILTGEALEMLLKFGNIFKKDSQQTLFNGGILTAVGKDYMLAGGLIVPM